MNQLSNPKPLQPKRRGVTIFEMVITTILIGSIMTTVAPLLRVASQQRQHAQQQQIATESANNLLELITATPYHKVTQSLAEELLAQEKKSATLQGAIWSVTIQKQQAEKSKSITVAITWEKKTRAPIQLTTWLYQLSGK